MALYKSKFNLSQWWEWPGSIFYGAKSQPRIITSELKRREADKRNYKYRRGIFSVNPQGYNSLFKLRTLVPEKPN